MPQENRLKPSFCKPATKAGPDAMPMMAMKMLRPTEFMNHTVGDGMRPKVGLTERNQPKKRPENNAPPAVDSVSRNAADLINERTAKRADGDRSTDEGHISDIGCPIDDAEHFGCRRDVLWCGQRA